MNDDGDVLVLGWWRLLLLLQPKPQQLRPGAGLFGRTNGSNYLKILFIASKVSCVIYAKTKQNKRTKIRQRRREKKGNETKKQEARMKEYDFI